MSWRRQSEWFSSADLSGNELPTSYDGSTVEHRYIGSSTIDVVPQMYPETQCSPVPEQDGNLSL